MRAGQGETTNYPKSRALVVQNAIVVQFTELPPESSQCANAHLLTIKFNRGVIDKPLR